MSAFIMLYLLRPSASHGDDARALPANDANRCPMFSSDPSDDEESGFAFRPSRSLQEGQILPQRLRFFEIDPMLVLVACAFVRIELKFHGFMTQERRVSI